MPIPIEMPKLSDTMTEGVLLRWHKKEGDKVEVGDVLADIETDKATMEMEAFDEGTIEKILVSAGSKVPIGGVLAQLSGGPSSPSSIPTSPSPTDKKSSSAPTPSDSSSAPRSSPPSPTTPPSGNRVKASPLAKKIAASRNIDLSTLSGTGPGGRIVSRDVESAPVGKSSVSTSGTASSPSTTPAPTNIPHNKIELTGMRRAIASRLLESKTQIPHFYAQIEVDAAPLMRLRKQLNEAAENIPSAPKITVNDFVLLATARAAALHPRINAAFAREAILQYETVHLAVAVAIEDGLVTPVIRDAQKLSLRKMSSEVKDLANRARNKKLKPDEYQGGTITVSSLGSYGIESFSAIINPPQAAILAIGAIVKKPVVDANDQIVVGQRFSITLSCDHRVIDGAVAAEFLGTLRKLIESPESLLL